MKSILEIRAVVHASGGIRLFRRSALTLGGVALASLLATVDVHGQGAYYPVNPPGSTNYTGITIHSNPNLQALQNKLQSLYGPTVTLQVPIPTGDTAPTTAQYSATVNAVVTDVQNGLDAGYGITLASLANEAIAWNLAARQTTTTAIAQAVIAVDYTQNSNPSQAIADLATVSQALGISQPTQIDSIVPYILGQAQLTATMAQGIPQIVSAAISQIPTDLTRIASITSSGLNSIANSNQTSTQKTGLFTNPSTGYIETLLNSTAAANNPSVIQTMTQSFTYSGYLGMASLAQILTSAEVTLPNPTNNTLAAITNGALLSQGSSSSTILTVMQSNAPAGSQPGSSVTYSQYIGGVVGGYSNSASLTAFQTYVTANPNLADAAAAGAVVKGSLSGAVILQNALNLGETGAAGEPNPANVVAEAILANVTAATSTIAGAINTSAHEPYGYPNVSFGQVALGAAEGAQIQTIGNLVATIVTDSAASITSLNTSTVQSIVQNAISGANSAGNSGAYGDIVYKAETVARNTTGASAALVTAAISQISTDGGLPYIAPVAAAAGDIYGANRTAIQGAANSTLTGPNLVAADQGMALVQNIQANSATHYTTILSAFNTAQGTSADAVRADVYASIMTDSSEYDADLAAALKETPESVISDTTLTTDAENAIRGINASLTPNLVMVDTVVEHIITESTVPGGGASTVGDLFDFVTHQIVINSSLTNDIVIAATVVDPDHAHYVATAAAFQAPMTVYGSVASIFEYAQITNPHPLALPTNANPTGALGTKTFPGQPIAAIIDQPAAAAAITAGLTTGILEANLSPANTQTALSSTVSAAVAASVTQNGTLLQGPTSPFNGTGSGTQFQQIVTSGSSTAITSARTVGAAGAITGYIAEVTSSGQTTISSITAAVLTAAVGGGARPYAMQMAQAAGQAFAWVSQTYDTTVAAGNPVYDIAEAMAPTVTGYATLAQLEAAVSYGITQAQNGVIGAGALGLNAGGAGIGSLNAGNGSLVVSSTNNANGNFYIHRSATGTPVTDIFNL